MDRGLGAKGIFASEFGILIAASAVWRFYSSALSKVRFLEDATWMNLVPIDQPAAANKDCCGSDAIRLYPPASGLFRCQNAERARSHRLACSQTRTPPNSEQAI